MTTQTAGLTPERLTLRRSLRAHVTSNPPVTSGSVSIGMDMKMITHSACGIPGHSVFTALARATYGWLLMLFIKLLTVLRMYEVKNEIRKC